VAASLLGCSSKPPPGPAKAPTFTNFGFTSGRVTMRPGNCASNALNYGSQPQLAFSDLELTIEGPGVLQNVNDLGGTVTMQVCSTLAVGVGKVKATVKQFPTYFVTADYSIGRPEGDPTVVLQPTRTFGHAPGIPTSLQWAPDATKLYVSYDFGVFEEWDVATLKPLRAWAGLGPRTKWLSPGRAVTNGAAAFLFDLDNNRSITWLSGPASGWETATLDTPSNAQTRGVAAVGDVLAIADRAEGGCAVGTVNLKTAEHTITERLDDAVGVPPPYFDPLAVYLDLSPNGRFLASAGEAFCGHTDAVTHESFGPAIVYDRQDDKYWSCGFLNTPLHPANTTASAFSSDGTVFGFEQGGVTLKQLPGCVDYGHATEPQPLHANVAISPDGTHLGYLNDALIAGRVVHEVRNIDITPTSPNRHPLDALSNTLSLGSTTPQASLDLGTPNYDFWSRAHHALAYSPDGKKLAVALLGGGVAIVDVATGTFRADAQMQLITSPLVRRVSPNGRYLAMSAQALQGNGGFEGIVDLRDGTVVFRGTANEHVLDAQDDGFYLQDGFATSQFKVDYATLTRTPVTGYVPPEVDRTSPSHTRRCTQVGQQQCIVDIATNTPVGCVPAIKQGLGLETYATTMVGETDCVISYGGALYRLDGTLQRLTKLAPDTQHGTFDSAALFRGPNPREFVAVGTWIGIWRLP
jgi:hypothetical protein